MAQINDKDGPVASASHRNHVDEPVNIFTAGPDNVYPLPVLSPDIPIYDFTPSSLPRTPTDTINFDPLHYVNATSIGLDEDIDPDSNLINTSTSPSTYYLEEAFENIITEYNLQSNIKILHVNIRSYSKNQDVLWSYLDNLMPKFHIIAITEIWSNLENADLLNHYGYKTYVKPRIDGRGGELLFSWIAPCRVKSIILLLMIYTPLRVYLFKSLSLGLNHY